MISTAAGIVAIIGELIAIIARRLNVDEGEIRSELKRWLDAVPHDTSDDALKVIEDEIIA